MKIIFFSVLCFNLIFSGRAQEEPSGPLKRPYSQLFGSDESRAQKRPKTLVEESPDQLPINFNNVMTNREIVGHIVLFLRLPKNDPTREAVMNLVHFRRVSRWFNILAKRFFLDRRFKDNREFTFTGNSDFSNNFLFFTCDFVNVCPHIESLSLNKYNREWSLYNLDILRRHYDKLRVFRKITEFAINIDIKSTDNENSTTVALPPIGDYLLHLMTDFTNLKQLTLNIHKSYFHFAPQSYEGLTSLIRLENLDISLPHENIAALGKLTSLTSLRINRGIVINAPLNFLLPLINLVSLRIGCLQCYNGLYTLAPLSQLTNLRHLELPEGGKKLLESSEYDATPVPGFTRHLLPLLKIEKIEGIEVFSELGSLNDLQMDYSENFLDAGPPEQVSFTEDRANYHLLNQRMRDNNTRNELKS